MGALAIIGNDERVLTDLVDRIQSESRDNIFKMDLDVKYLREEKIFEKKLRPWLDQKIDLFMGGPQSDLVEYVLRRVHGAITADALVERMWRMLVFELMRGGQPMGGSRSERRD